MSKQFQCPKCRQLLMWNETDDIIQCPRCAARYKMHPRSHSVLMPPVGRGQVDLLTVPNESVIGGLPLIKTYIPQNWQYRCSLAGDRFDLVSNPFVMSVTFMSPDRSAKIVFTDESFYKHIEFTPQTAMLQSRLDDMTVSRSPSFFRLRSCVNADTYCDMLAQSCGLERLSVTQQKTLNDNELQKQNALTQKFLANGFINASAEIAGRSYSGYSPNGKNLRIYAETCLIRLAKMSNVSSVQMQPMPSVFGMRMMPQMVNRQIQEFFWDTQYEFTLLATPNKFDSAYAELQRIMHSLEHLQGMAQARANAMSLANNVQMNIAQNQSASLDRQSKIIADTNAYTSNIQQQIISNNAASHNKTANLYSEMINEVNTYHSTNGVVAASTQFDHVYQNTQYPDLYAAQRGNAFELGIDFEELDKTDGNY